MASEFVRISSAEELMKIGCHLLNTACPPAVHTHFVIPSKDFSSYKLESFPPLFTSLKYQACRMPANDLRWPGLIFPQLENFTRLVRIDQYHERAYKILHKWAFGLIDLELAKLANVMDGPSGIRSALELDSFMRGINRNFVQIHDPVEFMVNYDNYREDFMVRAEMVSEMFFNPPPEIRKRILNLTEELIEMWRKFYEDLKHTP